ncbi:MAG: acetate kinase [Elusimicrobia bacterium RIFOXYA2_FULL_39_19]|nr:MAG: acetate kinase [Elusimicrobia bacterium RIFOXYA2_FULL_39_19]
MNTKSDSKNVLVLNSGSSSVKYTLFDLSLNRIAKGSVERIGSAEAFIVTDTREVCNVPDHNTAVELVLNKLFSNVIKDKNDIVAIGHRVVHGGEKLTLPSVVTEEIKDEIRKCFNLAPLHNPHNLSGILACEKLLPGISNIAVFDTAFYQTIPQYAYLYALPYYLYKKHNIRRYGFHGISHQFVAEKTAELLNEPLNKLKLITCHLGNGCSITATKYGAPVDTSMGFTPLEGLIMGTRCGDMDPTIVSFISTSENMSLNDVNKLLTSQSGLYGISGISNDMRTLTEESEKGNERAKIAIEMFCYRVKKYIGSYSAALNGADAIVFTAGIGENSPTVRQKCIEKLDKIGIEFDASLNKETRQGLISKKDSPVKALVVPTNEELMIAKQVITLTNN